VLEAPRYDVKPLFILMSQSSRISGKPCDQFVCMKLSGSIKPFVQWLDIGYKNVSSVSSLHIFSPPSVPPSSLKLRTDQSHHSLNRFALDLSQVP